MRLPTMLTLLAAAGTLARPVEAAPPGSSEDIRNWPGVRMEKANLRSTDPHMRIYAACLIRERFDRVAHVLTAPPHTPEAHKATRALVEDGECAEYIVLNTNASSIRRSLIEMLYVRDFIKGAGHPSVSIKSDESDIALAKCVVSLNPTAAERLIATTSFTKKYAIAFDAIAPDISRCGASTPESEDRRLHLRYRIAEALYQARSGGSVTSVVPAQGVVK